MSLNYFNFLKEDVRLVKYQNHIYKFKILYNDKDKLSVIVPKFSQKEAHEDLEKVVRAVLYILDKQGNFQPIQTDKFLVNVKTKPWGASQKLGFKTKGNVVKTHPFMIILTVKLKSLSHNNNSSNKPVPLPANDKFKKLKKEARNCNVRVLNKLQLPKGKNDANRTSPDNSRCQSSPFENETNNLSSSRSEAAVEHDSEIDLIVAAAEIETYLENRKSSPVRKVINAPDRGSPVIPWMDISVVPLTKNGTESSNNVEIRKRKIQTRSTSAKAKAASSRLSQGKTPTNKINEQDKHKIRNSVLSWKSRGQRQRRLSHSSIRLQKLRAEKRKQNLLKSAEAQESLRLKCQIRPLTQTKVRRSPRNINNNCRSNLESSTIKSPGINVSQLNLSRKDRHFVEQEELAEDMKLQQLAKSSPNLKHKTREKSKRRKLSGVWGLVENIISPVKNIFSRK